MNLKQSLAGSAACVLASATMLWAGTAAAVNSDGYDIPYIGAGYNYEIPDPARDSSGGQGAQFQIGMPLAAYGYENWAAEATLHMLSRDRDIDGKNDYQTGLLFDLVYDFGQQGFGNFGGGYQFKPFVLGGLGVVQNDVRGDRNEHFGVNLGGGVLLPLGRFGWKGLAVRLEARALGQVDSDSTDHNFVVDYRFSAGLQLPLFFLFNDNAHPVPPAQDCELAVVDPVTGRSDCGVDSDRDGVSDSKDLCPGTPVGTGVDSTGCPIGEAHPGDEDSDGVPNETDRCPGTRPGLQVDASGCMISQSLQLSGVQFSNNTAVLTDDARKILDGVASTLKNQPNVAVQIAGNTDNVGNKAYNLMLSQQRAESVRQYLVARGVDAGRLVATGFGDFHPVAPNDSEEGRAKNRRVDFKLIVQ